MITFNYKLVQPVGIRDKNVLNILAIKKKPHVRGG